MTDQAMIFAAGEGKRMRPLTLNKPKPLLLAGGKPLIVWQLEKLADLGIKKVVINTSHLGKQLPEALGTGATWGLQINYSPEQQPLETGGGLLQALPLLSAAPFLVVNGDTWCSPLPDLKLEPGKLAQLLLVSNPDHHPEGDFYFDQTSGQLGNQAFANARAFTFAGISLLDPDCLAPRHQQAAYQRIFSAGEAFALAPLLRHLVDQGLAAAQVHGGDWQDVGTPQRLKQLNEQLA
ncbi:nucleotidyltransferase family protein [Marinospirillum sp.]|uniref:nucleotidyltransferase family protein n=1 Tax=Marinospirillum sp. TaxID=2183934 RepID=UPI0028706B9D|nr:nucleotidyltransferase family protein [Marinospirillum sp.]MDR9466643.1 nucleotidyltransferase family protein [Marinospirillum sp.]